MRLSHQNRDLELDAHREDAPARPQNFEQGAKLSQQKPKLASLARCSLEPLRGEREGVAAMPM